MNQSLGMASHFPFGTVGYFVIKHLKIYVLFREDRLCRGQLRLKDHIVSLNALSLLPLCWNGRQCAKWARSCASQGLVSLTGHNALRAAFGLVHKIVPKRSQGLGQRDFQPSPFVVHHASTVAICGTSVIQIPLQDRSKVMQVLSMNCRKPATNLPGFASLVP